MDGGFAARCNQTLVGLDELDGEDRRRVRGLLLEHRERTGSRAAAAVLADFDRAPLVKVIPHDYGRRVLERSRETRRRAPHRVTTQVPRRRRMRPRGPVERDPPERDPRTRTRDHQEIFLTLPAGELASRAGVAWTAASRSAIRAARSGT